MSLEGETLRQKYQRIANESREKIKENGLEREFLEVKLKCEKEAKFGHGGWMMEGSLYPENIKLLEAQGLTVKEGKSHLPNCDCLGSAPDCSFVTNIFWQ